MRDAAELERLKSSDIKSVEVISNPGSRYNAAVRAVVKIRTKKAVGDGFGLRCTLCLLPVGECRPLRTA